MAYWMYPKLLDERKWARTHVGKPFPFLSLPVEIRLEVYRYLLVQDSPIELWPHVKYNTTFTSCQYRKQAFLRYWLLTPRLRLLRVCSAIHDEASEIFYGEQEFRFSGINAWMVLDAFMHTIGPRHLYSLRHITVHVPFPGDDHLAKPTYTNQTFRERICFSHTRQHVHFRKFITRMGLRPPRLWEYDIALARCTDTLSASYKLRTLKLVLPPTFYTWQPSDELEWYWRRIWGLKCLLDADRAVQNRVPLHVGFIFLKHKDNYQNVEWMEGRELRQSWRMRFIGGAKQTMARLRVTDWIDSIEYGIHSNSGNYRVMDREKCEKLAGPMSMKLEELDENDFVIGHDDQGNWVWAE